jgi:hypothetical protein
MNLTLSMDFPFTTGFSHTQGLEGARYGWGNWFGEFEKALEA